jgi:hypothetical protein
VHSGEIQSQYRFWENTFQSPQELEEWKRPLASENEKPKNIPGLQEYRHLEQAEPMLM